ncbi:MAG: hypothetical protein A3J85_00605 [Desulfobacula sp. RIFOXYA12_FULL_46_16]|nr:MAG: hypothetical protein A3J85_00605 [Desulfobacula sp. RIFOXYA12_FULL_46_16]
MRPKARKGCREIRRAVVKSGRSGVLSSTNGFQKNGRIPEVSSAAKSHTCEFSPAFVPEPGGFLRTLLK